MGEVYITPIDPNNKLVVEKSLVLDSLNHNLYTQSQNKLNTSLYPKT